MIEKNSLKRIKIIIISSNRNELNDANLVLINYVTGLKDSMHLIFKSSYLRSIKNIQIALPTKERWWCFLKSPHVNKIAREHFSSKKYVRLHIIDIPNNIEFELMNSKLINIFPSGVLIQCTMLIYENNKDG